MFFENEVVVNVRDKILKTTADSLIYWKKCGHYYGNTDIPWRHSWIHFDGCETYAILQNAGLENFQIINPPAGMVGKFLTEIDREMTTPSPDMVIVRNRFEIFIREIFRAGVKNPNAVQVPERMLEIKRYIETNYHQTLPLAETARKFSISSPHFSMEFKRWFGISPGKLQTECRLREAEILLKDKNLQITDIAEKVGWNDVYHFSKIFKKHRGIAPSRIRK
jgi:AraC-like DNA-binding protein